MGEGRAESFSAYSVLNDPSPAYIIEIYKEKGRARAQRPLELRICRLNNKRAKKLL